MDSHRVQNKLGSGCPNEAPKSLSRDYSEQGSQGVWLVPLDAGLASVEKQLVPLRWLRKANIVSQGMSLPSGEKVPVKRRP